MMDEPRANVLVTSGSSADLDDADRPLSHTLVPATTHTESSTSTCNSQSSPMEQIVPSDYIETDEMEIGEPWPENESEIAERLEKKLRAFRRAPSMDLRQWAPRAIAYWKQRCAITTDVLRALRQHLSEVPGAEPVLVGVSGAAKLLDISVNALRIRTQRGQMPAGSVVRTGRRIQYKVEALRAMRPYTRRPA